MKKPNTENPWKTIASRKIYENPWIELEEHDVINPGGKQGIYGKVHFRNRAIGIIPLDNEGYTWLVGQHRYTLNEYSWEIPEGGGALAADPLDEAKRELKEETGLVARHWELIMRFHTSNSVTDELGLVYLAEDIEQGMNAPEDTEADLIVMKVPFITALNMVMNNEITDSMSVAGILKVARIKGF